MGVEFYAAKRGRKTEEIHHSGYGSYNCIRTYLLACFNVPLAKAYSILEGARTPQESAMLQDISPYVPEAAWPLFCSSDCEGEWDNATVKGIVAAVKESRGYNNPDSVKQEIGAIVSAVPEEDKIHLCGFEYIPDWRDRAVGFVANLERVGEKGCRVFWC